jgi:hypothetical protein
MHVQAWVLSHGSLGKNLEEDVNVDDSVHMGVCRMRSFPRTMSSVLFYYARMVCPKPAWLNGLRDA